MRFEVGDVVRVPFPHVETNKRRYRPALVVTKEPLGPDESLIWAAMITSAERQPWPGDIRIEAHESVGLPIASMVRTAKIATLEAETAERIGRVDDKCAEAVARQLRQYLAL